MELEELKTIVDGLVVSVANLTSLVETSKDKEVPKEEAKEETTNPPKESSFNDWLKEVNLTN